MNIVCNMLVENTSAKTLQHGTINVLNRIFFVFIVFVINADLVLSFRNISKYVLALFLGFIILFRVWELVHFAILFLFIHLAFLLPSVLANLPAVPLLIPFVLSTVIVVLYSPTRSTLSWFKKGHLDSVSIFLLFTTGAITTAALVVWALWTDNLGVGLQMIQGISHYPHWLIWGIGIPAFALLNALAEELVYRGVMQTALSRVFNQKIVVFVLQASAFAAIHFLSGFPNGITGYLMVFVYGLMLGYLRDRTEGMLAPYLAHVGADLTIGYFLYVYGL